MKHVLLIICLCWYSVLLSQQRVYFSSEKNTSGGDIYVLNTQNSNLEKLTVKLGTGHYPHYINPKLSPDGSRLVFQADTDGHDRYAIWTMKTDGSEMKRITTEEGLFPNWSPDGKTIVFSGRRNGVWEILLIPSMGGNEIIISNNLQNNHRPGWGATCSFHPNGNELIYSYVREKKLFSLDIKSGNKTQITMTGNYTHPVYSSDGKSIAVNRKLEKAYDLVLIRESKELIIAESVISYSAPDWFANDSKLLFVGSINGSQELLSIDLAGKQEVQLTKNNTFDAMPVAY